MESNLIVTLNPRYSHFTVLQSNILHVYDLTTCRLLLSREFESLKLSYATVLCDTNLFLIVPASNKKLKYGTSVMLYDDTQNTCVFEIEFDREIKQIKCSHERLLVCFDSRVFVLEFNSLHSKLQFDTCETIGGLIDISPSYSYPFQSMPKTKKKSKKKKMLSSSSSSPSISNNKKRLLNKNDSKKSFQSLLSDGDVIALLGDITGEIRIVSFADRCLFNNKIVAHDHTIEFMKLNIDGSLVATSSSKGTLIRVFETHSASQVFQLRRGSKKARIFSIAWNQNSSLLATTSSTGTVHIFLIPFNKIKEGEKVITKRKEKIFGKKSLFKIKFPKEEIYYCEFVGSYDLISNYLLS
ncbi:wd repeat domain phosphoinositide-interacting protein [Anaeramoeba flamelloides]|uniref:Wd repeat domain phosphoinositide-interacting protein n=1 Tax=Anaeramoeba flamelloides TaxID=1746091 RepID=A0AAV7ZW90_9EUKA|nr:wd repeat domain phosphoinositide-interacting protein [Anaeramoeba flamelloides]KAJ6252253.1 wd repeat domain phosphoinositide-interacting protein [Anaeramoeba flamelloides]